MVDSNEEHVTEQEHVVEREESHEGSVNQLARVVWFLVGIIVTFLLVRVVLALIGANLENQFANFIYMVTDPFVVVFRGLLQVGQFQAGVSRFELETLLAAVVYGLIGWGLASAVRLFSKRA